MSIKKKKKKADGNNGFLFCVVLPGKIRFLKLLNKHQQQLAIWKQWE